MPLPLPLPSRERRILRNIKYVFLLGFFAHPPQICAALHIWGVGQKTPASAIRRVHHGGMWRGWQGNAMGSLSARRSVRPPPCTHTSQGAVGGVLAVLEQKKLGWQT